MKFMFMLSFTFGMCRPMRELFAGIPSVDPRVLFGIASPAEINFDLSQSASFPIYSLGFAVVKR